MEILGKTTINPFIFFTGKTGGYFTWIVLILSLTGINIIHINSNGTLKTIAMIIFASGIIIIIFSLYYPGKSVRVGLPNTKTVLKQSGIYRYSRNPMYLGVHLFTLSAMVYTMNLIVIFLGLFSFIAYHYIILGEEEFLADRFGEQYLIYKKNVPRYF